MVENTQYNNTDEVSTTSYESNRGKPISSKNHAIIQKSILVLLVILYGDNFEILPELKLKGNKTKNPVPDISIFEKTLSFTPGDDEIMVETIPLGVIEILSPKQNIDELIKKSRNYFSMGIQSYWLVIPDLRSIFIFDKNNKQSVFTEKDKLQDSVLNIEIDLEKIFY